MSLNHHKLQLVCDGLVSLLGEINNQIATCPEPEHYAVELAAYEDQREELEQLLADFQKATLQAEVESLESLLARITSVSL